MYDSFIDHRWFTYHWTPTSRYTGYTNYKGKGRDEKDEYVKLPNEVATAIEMYIFSKGSYKKEDPLFSSTGNRANGCRLTEPSISRIIKNVFKAAGYDCDKLTAHSLRHTSNTLLFKAGADLYTVQRHAA